MMKNARRGGCGTGDSPCLALPVPFAFFLATQHHAENNGSHAATVAAHIVFSKPLRRLFKRRSLWYYCQQVLLTAAENYVVDVCQKNAFFAPRGVLSAPDRVMSKLQKAYAGSKGCG